MGQHLGSKVFVGMALAVVAALGITQPGASAESAPAPGMLPPTTMCPVAPEVPAGDAQMLPQCPTEPTFDPCSDDSDGDGIPDCSDPCPYPTDPCNQPTQPPTTAPPTTEPPTTPPTTTPTTNPPGNAPTLGPAPTTGPVPEPVAIPGCASGCLYQREVGLRLKGTQLRGTISSPATGCRTGATVTVWRVHKKADRRLVIMSAKSNGAFATKRPARAGKYYVTVTSPEQPMCATAKSRKITLKR